MRFGDKGISIYNSNLEQFQVFENYINSHRISSYAFIKMFGSSIDYLILKNSINESRSSYYTCDNNIAYYEQQYIE